MFNADGAFCCYFAKVRTLVGSFFVVEVIHYSPILKLKPYEASAHINLVVKLPTSDRKEAAALSKQQRRNVYQDAHQGRRR